jgi:hypothetical protein
MQKNSAAMILVAFLLLIGGGIGAWAMFAGGEEPKKVKEQPKVEAAASEDETPAPVSAPSPSRSSSNTPSEPEKPVEVNGAPLDATLSGWVQHDVGGKPTGIRGVTVILVDADHPQTLLAETETDSKGEYTFVIGRYRTRVSKVVAAVVSRGYEVKTAGRENLKSWTYPDARSNGSDINFCTVRDASTLEATVLNADEKDAPMEGASVNWTADPLYASLLARYNGVKDGDPAKLLTDSQGMLALGGLPPADQSFVAAKKGYSGTPFGAAVNRAELKFKTGATEKFTFRLTQSGVLIGRVVIAAGPALVMTDEDGKEITKANVIPVADAVVELGEGFGDKVDSVMSDSEGKFRFESVPALKVDINQTQPNLPRGARQRAAQGFTIRVAKPGTGHGQSRGVTVKPNEVTDVKDITLKVGAALTGIVQDDHGNPVGGAEVAVVEGGGLPQAMMKNIGGIRRPRQFTSTKSGPDGRFSLDPVPAAPPAEAVAAPAGNPGGGRGNVPGGPGGFANMFGGGGTELLTTARSFTSDLQNLTELKAGETRELIITLKPGSGISGVVVDEKGYGLAGVSVGTVKVADDPMSQGMAMMFEQNFGMQNTMPGFSALKTNVITAEDGSWEIADLEPGKYNAVAYGEKYGRASAKDIMTKAGEVTGGIKITMKVQAAIYGVVFDGNQKPKANAKVTAYRLGTMQFPTVDADGEGRYEFAGLSPGTYTVKLGDTASLMSGGFENMLNMTPAERVAVAAGQRVEHNVYERLEGTVTVWGRVTLDGAPYTGALTWGGFGFDGISMKTAKCDEKGEYRIEGMTPGAYDVTQGSMTSGTMKLLQPHRARVEREPGEQQIDIAYTTITITGIVVMTDGGALEEDTIVYASTAAEKNADGAVHPRDYFRSQLPEQVKPDLKTGIFEIKNLAPGTYFVSARSKKGGYKRVGPLKLEKSVGGIRLELAALTGTLEGTVENYIARSDASPLPMGPNLDAVAILTFEDSDGNVVTLGNLDSGGNPLQGDNTVDLKADASGLIKFTKVGFPAGTWTITMQVNNYAPVTLKNIVIGPDAPANARFVLAASGDVEIQITNTDLSASAAQDISYTIKDSRGGTYIKRFTFLDLMNNMLNPPSAGKKNTFVLKDFPPDTYTMTMTLPGYRPETRKFTVFSKNLTPVSYTFQSDGSGK